MRTYKMQNCKNITIQGSLDDGMSWPEHQQVLLDEGTGWGYACLSMVDRITWAYCT